MRRFATTIGSHMVTAAVVGAGAFGLWRMVPATGVAAATELKEARGGSPSDGTTRGGFADVIEAVRPAVVNIATRGYRLTGVPHRGEPGAPPLLNEFFRHFFERQSSAGPDRSHSRATGSGFVIDPQGLVVTNHHVVAGAEEIVVTLDDGSSYQAQAVGMDRNTDLALLRIEADEPLPFVAFGDSDAMRVGDWVIAIGNPFGLGGTATTGIVSARGRDLRSGPFDDFLQIDAPINRGKLAIYVTQVAPTCCGPGLRQTRGAHRCAVIFGDQATALHPKTA